MSQRWIQSEQLQQQPCDCLFDNQFRQNNPSLVCAIEGNEAERFAGILELIGRRHAV
jgi:hypothetical protein